MRHFTLTLIVCIAIIAGCEPAATFTEPQPAHADARQTFPKRLHGKYLDTAGSAMLIIEEGMILIQFNQDSVVNSIHLSDVDTSHEDSTGTDFEKAAAVLNQKERDDNRMEQDTLFATDAAHVLKQYMGYYFLNTLRGDTAWEVQKLSVQRGVLTLSSIAEGEDLSQLQAVNPTPADTVSKSLSPNRRQFRKFIKSGGFSNDGVFVKMRE